MYNCNSPISLCSDVRGMNGFSTEEESRSGHDQICCLLDDGQRCRQPAGNASYSKRIEKTVQQRRLKLNIDHNVSRRVVRFMSVFYFLVCRIVTAPWLLSTFHTRFLHYF